MPALTLSYISFLVGFHNYTNITGLTAAVKYWEDDGTPVGECSHDLDNADANLCYTI